MCMRVIQVRQMAIQVQITANRLNFRLDKKTRFLPKVHILAHLSLTHPAKTTLKQCWVSIGPSFATRH